MVPVSLPCVNHVYFVLELAMAKQKQYVLDGDSNHANEHVNGHFKSHLNGLPKNQLSEHLNGHTNSHLAGLANGAAKLSSTDNERTDRTDVTRWRLLDESGCQTWHYLDTEEKVESWPQSDADKYFLGLSTVCDARRYTH